jgi:uncharacterized protein
LTPNAADWREKFPSLSYIAPFAAFILLLALGSRVALDTPWIAALRVVLLAVICVICWPRELSTRPAQPLLSITVGVLVFVLWIAPDLLIPGYRQNILFSNAIIGHTHSSIQPNELRNSWVLFWRTVRAVLIVPVVEELFWRAWLMRWLINPQFRQVRIGTYAPLAFWLTAALFASEHGPYWDVGLITGVIYNAWLVRTRSVASCILMHAVTNACLSAYVIYAGQWQYWQ